MRVMMSTTRDLARKLADAEHENDVHVSLHNTPFYDAVFEHAEDVRASISDEIYYSPEFFAAYAERRRERNAECDAGRPFAVIEGALP